MADDDPAQYWITERMLTEAVHVSFDRETGVVVIGNTRYLMLAHDVLRESYLIEEAAGIDSCTEGKP